MVELKVREFENSLEVVLPKEVINRLHTADGQALFLVEAPNGGYQLTPYDPGFERKMAKASLAAFLDSSLDMWSFDRNRIQSRQGIYPKISVRTASMEFHGRFCGSGALTRKSGLLRRSAF